uniref:Uncharacterized protein n=1 Tax=Arundo donax TaxID=35708 RepID=A0A0A9CQX5_ARUDO
MQSFSILRVAVSARISISAQAVLRKKGKKDRREGKKHRRAVSTLRA